MKVIIHKEIQARNLDVVFIIPTQLPHPPHHIVSVLPSKYFSKLLPLFHPCCLSSEHQQLSSLNWITVWLHIPPTDPPHWCWSNHLKMQSNPIIMALADILPQLPQDLDTTQNLARNDNILPNTAAPPPCQGSCCQLLTGPRGSPHRPGGSVGTLFLLFLNCCARHWRRNGEWGEQS